MPDTIIVISDDEGRPTRIDVATLLLATPRIRERTTGETVVPWAAEYAERAASWFQHNVIPEVTHAAPKNRRERRRDAKLARMKR